VGGLVAASTLDIDDASLNSASLLHAWRRHRQRGQQARSTATGPGAAGNTVSNQGNITATSAAYINRAPWRWSASSAATLLLADSLVQMRNWTSAAG
jgi:hypothetical protein